VELGMHELIFPPPPIPEVTEDESDEDGDDEQAPGLAEHLRTQFSPQEQKLFSAPPPLRAILSEGEVFERAEAAMKGLSDPRSLLNYFQEKWPGLPGAIDEATGETLSDDEFTLLAAMVARAVLVLFPGGPPDTPVNERRLTWYFADELKLLSRPDHADSEGAVIRYINASPEPHLTVWLCGMLLAVTGNKESPLAPQDALKLLPVIKAVVRELCQLPPQ